MNAATETFVVYGFAVWHDGLAAESAMKWNGLDVMLVPAPPVLGAKCGVAVRVRPEDADYAQDTMKLVGVRWTARATLEDRVLREQPAAGEDPATER